MAKRLNLQTSSLPGISESEASATASPARGQEMRKKLQTKLRPPPFVHQWEFWHDRQDRELSAVSSPAESPGIGDENYETRLRKLHAISDVREFWEVYNNFDIATLRLRDSIHLFHRGVKPVWEDPRNAKGGAWTFRVPMALAKQFWIELSLMAIGEKLQEAVTSDRTTFKDDICGISLSVRTSSCLLMVWNRDAEHTEGIQKILQTISDGLSSELKPREGSFYYKKHSEHNGFKGSIASSASPQS